MDAWGVRVDISVAQARLLYTLLGDTSDAVFDSLGIDIGHAWGVFDDLGHVIRAAGFTPDYVVEDWVE